MLVDGAQSVPHMPVDCAGSRLRFPGLLLAQDARADRRRRALGPARDLLEAMRAVPGRRRDDRDRRARETTYNVLPWKYEAGTPNIADVIAFGAAIDYLEAVGMERVREHEVELTTYALEKIGSDPRRDDLRPEGRRRSAAAWSRSRWTTSTRTTSGRSWTTRAWRFGPGSTAARCSRSRSAFRRRLGRASTCTTLLRRWTPSSRPSRASSRTMTSLRTRRSPPLSLDDLYKEVILDHYQHPRNRGQLEDAGRCHARATTRSAATRCCWREDGRRRDQDIASAGAAARSARRRPR